MSKPSTPYTKYKLYFLCTPAEADPHETVRYIGISNNTARRYRQHLESARTGRGGNARLRRWIRSLVRRDLAPTMKVLHFEGTLEGMRRQEVSVIQQYRDHDLLNSQHNTTPRYRRWPTRKLPRGRKIRTRRS